MKTCVRFLILAPFAVALVAVYPALKALDWAISPDDPTIGSLFDELRDSFGRRA